MQIAANRSERASDIDRCGICAQCTNFIMNFDYVELLVEQQITRKECWNIHTFLYSIQFVGFRTCSLYIASSKIPVTLGAKNGAKSNRFICTAFYWFEEHRTITTLETNKNVSSIIDRAWLLNTIQILIQCTGNLIFPLITLARYKSKWNVRIIFLLTSMHSTHTLFVKRKSLPIAFCSRSIDI